ncbi:MAG: hypothetical protein GY934_14595, partial [Gammaproteobacteria bacterium]|nr:hypothetical protein [Gammaproteobacteria bacterium]
KLGRFSLGFQKCNKYEHGGTTLQLFWHAGYRVNEPDTGRRLLSGFGSVHIGGGGLYRSLLSGLASQQDQARGFLHKYGQTQPPGAVRHSPEHPDHEDDAAIGPGTLGLLAIAHDDRCDQADHRFVQRNPTIFGKPGTPNRDYSHPFAVLRYPASSLLIEEL